MLYPPVGSYLVFLFKYQISKPDKPSLKIEDSIIHPLPYALSPSPHALCAMPYVFTSPFRIPTFTFNSLPQHHRRRLPKNHLYGRQRRCQRSQNDQRQGHTQ